MGKKHKTKWRGGSVRKPHGATYADVLVTTKRAQAQDMLADLKENAQTQRALWLACIAMNDAFGTGPKRYLQWADALRKRTDWYNMMKAEVDDVYANEMLRRRASKCTRADTDPLYDEAMILDALRRYAKRQGVSDTELLANTQAVADLIWRHGVNKEE